MYFPKTLFKCMSNMQVMIHFILRYNKIIFYVVSQILMVLNIGRFYFFWLFAVPIETPLLYFGACFCPLPKGPSSRLGK